MNKERGFMVTKTKKGLHMGRKPKKVDWKVFEELCALQCTEIEIALEFDMHISSLNTKCKEHYGATFSEVFSEKRMNGIKSLRRRMHECAFKPGKPIPVLQIWLDKKYAHKQGDVDQRAYGGKGDDSVYADKKIEIEVTYVDTPTESMKEKFLSEGISDEDKTEDS